MVRKFTLLVIISSILLIPLITFANTNPDASKILAKTANLKIPFVENQGQVKDNGVKFFAQTFAGTVFVTDKGEIVYGLVKPEEKSKSAESKSQKPEKNESPSNPPFVKGEKGGFKSLSLRETLVGLQNLSIKGESKAATQINYFVGDKSNWKKNIPTWESVNLGEVYNGIELKLKAYSKNIEKLFIVNSEGNVDDIKLMLDGAKCIKVNNAGELDVETALGSIKFTKPVAYQEIDGKTVEVKVEYIIANEKPSPFTYGFKVASYDKTYPLIIDPLLASTFIGGGTSEYATSIALDSSGNVFITGYAPSGYPTTVGSYDTLYNSGLHDVLISKLDSNLGTLLCSTYIGGSSADDGYALVIDSSDNIFVAGYTSSSDYPTTSGAYDTLYNGSGDSFVSKFNNNLDTLISSTYIGGDNSDYISCLALSASGDLYLAGDTYSSGDYGFPTTPGAYDRTYNGLYGWNMYSDAFVSRMNNSLSSLLSSTFIGGEAGDYSNSIALDSSGNVYVTGSTISPDYPFTFGAYEYINRYNPHVGYTYDVFVSKLNSNLTSLLSSTIIGGYGGDIGCAIGINFSGDVYVAGETYSSNYPTTAGAYDRTLNYSYDGFVSKFNNNLSTLLSSTFIGGDNTDYIKCLALNASGDLYLAGNTYSSGTYGFPTSVGAYDTTHNGSYDVFVSKMNSSLSSLLYSTFIGGSDYDYATSIALDSSGNIYLAGYTISSNYPVTSGAYDSTFNGGSDIFISKLGINDLPTAITLSSFTANYKGKMVMLKWRTASEIDNLGFNIYRSDSEDGEYIKINKKTIKAKGSSTKGASYNFKDTKIEQGKSYWYILEDIDSINGPTKHDPVKAEGKSGKVKTKKKNKGK
ncbi:MAG: SBBP repeat-containing protein [Candidatus Schekmanbacteria bacterium]|nr:SBBP repeat-containing protein [Candidatus Schekmanbacteria bacterium]